MHAAKRARSKTHQIGVKLTAQQYEVLDAKRQSLGMSMAECVRRELLERIGVPEESRKLMLVTAIGIGIQQRLHAAGQKGEDLRDPNVFLRLEKQAIAAASATVDRWLFLVDENRKGKAS